MLPVVPSAKRASGFSIDSLMSKDRTSPRSPPTVSSVPRVSSASPPASSSVPSSAPRLSLSPESISAAAAHHHRERGELRGEMRGDGSRLDPPRDRDGPREQHHPRDHPVREHTIGGLGSSFHPVHPSSALLSGLKNLHGGSGLGPHPESYPEGLAALGLAPAALQAGAAAHLPPGLTFPGGLPGPHHGLPHHPVFLGAAQRDPLTLYPWLLSRHGSYFGHPRLGGHEANFLFQPFRKPKRIRTAFSPSQLLRLEHAFEKNHYVVGQERKDLAANLSLTETQVKVWFQNRRTKYKRMKAEESEGKEGGDKAGSSASGSDHLAEEDNSELGSHNGDVSPHPLDCSYREIDIVHDDDDGESDIDIDDDVTPPNMTSFAKSLQASNERMPTSPTPMVPTSHIDRWLQQQPPNHV